MHFFLTKKVKKIENFYFEIFSNSRIGRNTIKKNKKLKNLLLYENHSTLIIYTYTNYSCPSVRV